MTAISNNVYFDVLNDIVDKYKNTYHKTMKPIKSNERESNEKDPKFKVGNHTKNFKV